MSIECLNCPVCGAPNAQKMLDYENDRVFYMCPICGRFQFTGDEVWKRSLDKNKLSSFLFYNGFHANNNYTELRYHTTLEKKKCDEYVMELENGKHNHGHPVHMDNDIIDAWYPHSFTEKIDKILLKLDEMSDYVGQKINISKYELNGLMFVKRVDSERNDLSEEEVKHQVDYFIEYLNKSGYIKGGMEFGEEESKSITITPEGYQRIDQLQRNTNAGRNALVAMKFGDETQKLREAIKTGIRDAGYNPILIDEVEHNELITPELLSHIKNSKFVVAELTHQNNGAYFEEGYAMGLGKPVIQLCRKDTKLHFDIAQKNTIIWETESDIPLRLKNRIVATID